MKAKKQIILFAVLAVILAGLSIWIAWGNTALEQTTHTVTSQQLPNAFHGYRIAQVSDLHNEEMGDSNEVLLAMLREAQPNLIAITGDLVDSRKTDLEVAIAFVRQAVQIAPCYYVPGNHEARLAEDTYGQLTSALAEAGVTVLQDDAVLIQKDGAVISLIGLTDPSFTGEPEASIDPQQICDLAPADCFTVLLSHKPEFFEQYAAADVDLVLSGHAHGGQFRLPLVGGLFTPSQGLFPKYDAGQFTQGNTTMIVSRGIGNSGFPFRINNRPEVLFIELHAA